MTGGRANGMRLFEDVWGRVAVITKVLTSSERSYQMDAAMRPGSKLRNQWSSCYLSYAH